MINSVFLKVKRKSKGDYLFAFSCTSFHFLAGLVNDMACFGLACASFNLASVFLSVQFFGSPYNRA